MSRKLTLYDTRRNSLLSCIFENNLIIWDDIDPFAYKRDIYDTLLMEQYLLYEGGDDAVEYAKEQTEQVKALIDEYYLSDKMKNICDELSDMYVEYINNYANKKGEENNAED